MTVYDALVIGAGHNGLICAAYLAKAGLHTLLIEARDDVGGCASTVDAIGARVNICNCDHLMVRATPIADELDLAAAGLRYLDVDPAFMALTWDGHPPWFLFSDPDRTVEWLRAAYPSQVPAYRAYLSDAADAARLVVAMAAGPATTPAMVRTALAAGGRGARRVLAWSRRSALDVLGGYFDEEALLLPALVTGPAVWGLDPDTPGTGLAALGYALRHQLQVGRPVGGSGALTDAIRAADEAAGGEVRCSERVLSVEHEAGAWKVTTDGGEYRALTVIGACDPRTVRVDLLGEVDGPDQPEGYESKIDAVLDDAPRYRALDLIDPDAGALAGLDPLHPTAVVSPTLSELHAACEQRREGWVAERPMLLVNVPSALDPSMRPPGGRHLLSLEVLWTPYSLAGGWPETTEPRRWLEAYSGLVQPGFLDSVVRWRAMTPPDYEAQFGMRRGYAPSFPGTPIDALLGRPKPLARYRTELPGLYLTGAATYPGAGIWGAPGRNAAAAVLSDRRSGARSGMLAG